MEGQMSITVNRMNESHSVSKEYLALALFISIFCNSFRVFALSG
jgi:hypothetical protein